MKTRKITLNVKKPSDHKSASSVNDTDDDPMELDTDVMVSALTDIQSSLLR